MSKKRDRYFSEALLEANNAYQNSVTELDRLRALSHKRPLSELIFEIKTCMLELEARYEAMNAQRKAEGLAQTTPREGHEVIREWAQAQLSYYSAHRGAISKPKSPSEPSYVIMHPKLARKAFQIAALNVQIDVDRLQNSMQDHAFTPSKDTLERLHEHQNALDKAFNALSMAVPDKNRRNDFSMDVNRYKYWHETLLAQLSLVKQRLDIQGASQDFLSLDK